MVLLYRGICTRCGRWVWAATVDSTLRWRWALSTSYPCRVEEGVAKGPSCKCPPVDKGEEVCGE